jgi:gluconate 2-dehydrogenase subunit 3-like protein
MAEKRALPMVDANPAPGVGRRELLQGLITGVGAGLAIPGLAEAHPMRAHLQEKARVATAQAKAKDADWKPEFLDAYQSETLASMAERIVPGSAAAKADRFIDSLLAVNTLEDQQRFLQAMGAIEAESRARFNKPWKELGEAEQTELLTAASTARPGREERYWTPGTPVMDYLKMQGGTSPTTLRDHFDHLKGWVSGAYYSSETGLKELGYTGQMFFESFPGCTHPDGHK